MANLRHIGVGKRLLKELLNQDKLKHYFAQPKPEPKPETLPENINKPDSTQK